MKVKILFAIFLGISITLVLKTETKAAITPPQYEIISIGTLGGSNTTANGINDNNQVVGVSDINEYDHHAFLWENGVMTDLGTLGGTWSEAYAINDKGQVVGYSLTENNAESHAFLWENGVMTDLGTLGGKYSWAYDINENGQIVGNSYNGVGTNSHAFLWENGVMTDLETLSEASGIYSAALAINDNKQVVGIVHISGGLQYAFLWENDIMTNLGGIAPGAGSVAWGINNSGQIVGNGNTDTGTRALLWENGVVTDLGSLGGEVNQAQAINNKGEILGHSYDTLPTDNTVLWIDKELINLNIGGTALIWTNLNEDGSFVAWNRIYKKIIPTPTPTVTPTPPFELKNINVIEVTKNSALITWRTDEKTDSRVDYGLDSSYGKSSYNKKEVSTHTIKLKNLDSNTEYHFAITSTNKNDESATSDDITFTTKQKPQKPTKPTKPQMPKLPSFFSIF